MSPQNFAAIGCAIVTVDDIVPSSRNADIRRAIAIEISNDEWAAAGIAVSVGFIGCKFAVNAT